MDDNSRTTPTVYSPALSGSHPDPTPKKQRLIRQISHRPHASHNFHMQRHPHKETAQQLGTDIANFLKPARSGAHSATTSRTISRHSSGGEGLLALESFGEDQNTSVRGPRPSFHIPSINLRRLQASKHALEQNTADIQKELIDAVLSGSRRVDEDVILIREELNKALKELASLRKLARTTSRVNLKLTDESVPDVSKEHEARLADLQVSYNKTRQDRIGGLEKRLKDSWYRVQVLKERIESVTQEVGGWESKDALELQRSRKRHFIFWVMIVTTVALILFLLFPRVEHQIPVLRAVPVVKLDLAGRFSTDEIGRSRLRSLPETKKSEDVRLRLFDEL